MDPTRVLIVEDERIVAFHLRQCLVKLGYHVVGVLSTGRQTLDRVAELEPDIVLMDVQIEGDMDGIETASHLRNKLPIPVIYLTAHDKESTLRRARATKPYGFLLKPVCERELHATIQMALERYTEEGILRANGEKYRDVTRGTSDWIWELDSLYRFNWISVSPALDDRIVESFSRGQTRGETIERGVTDAQWAAHRARLDQRLPIRDFRFERLDSNGELHHLTVSGDPIIDIAGQFQGYRGSGQDITQRIQTERALFLAKEEAESANRTKSQFLANMSHELRTPLNAVLGFAEIIRDGMIGPIDHRYRQYAGDIFIAGRHLLRVIGDVLDLSKIEAGRMELREEWVDLAEVIAACRRLIEGRADAAQVRLQIGISAGLRPIMADPSRLQQVILNLVANSVKFTPDGGLVRIDAWQTDGEGIHITVTDTGIGMAAKDIPAALAPFRQLESQLSRRFEGTGLGLPIAKTLVELHGGTLDIESRPGHGTRIHIRLPPERMMAPEAVECVGV
jgi:PAS domain S-box-containing protein